MRNVTSIVVKLFVLSLIVGIVLSVFDIRPESLLADFGETAIRIFRTLVRAAEWAVPYVLVGAVVVVPVWLIAAAIQLLRRRGK